MTTIRAKSSLLLLLIALMGCSLPAAAPEAAPPAPTLTRPALATVTATTTAVPTVAPASTLPPTNTAPATAVPAAPEQAAPPAITITVIAGDDTTVPQIKTGEIFTFAGARGPQWQIGYDSNMVTLLTTPEEAQQPGESWLFQANATPGTTRIWLENVPPPCTAEPCPPAGAAILLEARIEIINE